MRATIEQRNGAWHVWPGHLPGNVLDRLQAPVIIQHEHHLEIAGDNFGIYGEDFDALDAGEIVYTSVDIRTWQDYLLVFNLDEEPGSASVREQAGRIRATWCKIQAWAIG